MTDQSTSLSNATRFHDRVPDRDGGMQRWALRPLAAIVLTI